ncbi:MAG: hypothetical protein ACRC1K_17325 [Planctomycetia bacterium]
MVKAADRLVDLADRLEKQPATPDNRLKRDAVRKELRDGATQLRTAAQTKNSEETTMQLRRLAKSIDALRAFE